MKRLLLGAVLALPALAFSQGLKPGDIFAPAQQFEALNDTAPQLTFNRFKGVPLLLDFWFTTCTACLAGIPKLDSIQKQYEGKLKVVLVTWEKKEKVARMLTGYKRLRGISLPVVVEDTLLHRLFPHESVPYKVWIDAGGKVLATTDNRALTPGNLAAFVAGKTQGLAPGAAAQTPGELPPGQLLITDNLSLKAPVEYMFLCGYRPGLAAKPGIAFRDSTGRGLHIRAVNNTLAQLYKTTWGKETSFHESRVVFDEQECRTESEGQQRYCFEMISSDTVRARSYERMRRHLDAALGVRSSLQKRSTPVLVLKRQGAHLPITSSGNTPDIYEKNGRLIVENTRFAAVVSNLLNSPGYLPWPVVDETGYTGRADLELPLTFTDICSFNRALEPYGLYLETSTRELELIVLQPSR